MIITIAGIDQTKYVKWKSLRINNILTNQVDTCKFELKQKLRDGSTINPVNGSEVIVTHNSVKLFGGLILKIKNITDDFANVNFQIDCIDYTRLLDSRLVARDYQDKKVDNIIADIVNSFVNKDESIVTFEDITNWEVVFDAVNLRSSGDAKRGNNCAEFDLDVSASGSDFADIRNNSYPSSNWVAYKNEYAQGWVFIPAGLTATFVDFLFASDNWSNWGTATAVTQSDGSAFVSGKWNHVKIDLSTKTETGTPDYSAITQISLRIGYGAGQGDVVGVKFDEWRLSRQSGFISTANVNCQTVIEYISFRYHTVSQALKQLADITQFNWWIDYNKDIHFVSTGVELAPTVITDDNGTYEKDSLIIRNDNTQLRNVVYVRGGEYLGDTFTASYISDGTQNVYPLTYKYEAADFRVVVTGAEQDVGVEPTEVPDVYDLLWNDESRLIRFHRASRLPSNGSDIKVIGRRFLPVIAKVKDTGAVVNTQTVEGGSGEHEYIIIDKSIITKEGARQRANAELLAYASSLAEGEFVTQTAGFKAGQRVNVNSTNLNTNQNFIVSKVVRQMFTPDTPIYKITLITTRTFGIIEFFQKLLNKDKITLEINSNEITDTVEVGVDGITLTETVEISTSHNPQTDAIDLAETLTVQSPDWPVEFVYQPQQPSGFKRGALYNGPKYE